MNFTFNEEQLMWQKTVNDFIEREGGREYVRQCDMERRYPYELYEKVAKQGWLGLILPKEYGGDEADAIMYAIFMEAMGKYSYDTASAFGGSTFTIMNIVHHGTPEQKEYYLPRFIRGEIRASISLTEPEAGSDAASITTFAAADGDFFIVNGQKVFSSGAQAENNIIILAARTDKTVPKHRGISLFIVPNKTPGVELRLLPTIARRSTGTNEVFLTDVKIPRENLIGKLNEGWHYLMEHLDLERLAIGAALASNAQTVVDDALQYAKQRVQFGQPIGKFQAISHILADMQTEVDAAHLLVYRAAFMFSEGVPCSKEASMAKLYSSEVFYKVATQGMQILGGYSLLPESDMERYWREAKASTIVGGTSQIQRLIIARQMGL